MTPLDFLNLLWQFKPEDHYVLLWTQPDKRSHWYRDIEAAAEFVLKSPRAGRLRRRRAVQGGPRPRAALRVGGDRRHQRVLGGPRSPVGRAQ